MLSSQDIVASPTGLEFVWPSPEIIRTAQKANSTHRSRLLAQEEEGLWKVKGKTMITEDQIVLQLTLLICAHCGISGHRGHESTLSALKEEFHWKAMDDDCRDSFAVASTALFPKVATASQDLSR